MLRYCSLILLLCAPVHAETLTGTIRVVDADTIEISSLDIRLVGIDAPEMDQPCFDPSGATRACGEIATALVRRAYDSRTGRCDVEGRDRFGRALAVCHSDGREINADLVRRGIARIYRAGMRYEDSRYIVEQAEAMQFARGFWADEMQDPADWRAGRPAGAPAGGPEGGPVPRARAGGCDIKGNISDNGLLYHVPGGRSYGPTRIDEARGEQWFCSETEAQAAGWTRAGG